MPLSRRTSVSKWLREILEEPYLATTDPKNKVLARTLVNLALDEKNPQKIRLEAISIILDRMEGKAIQTNLNADIPANPFEGVPTKQLEALRAKLEAVASAPAEAGNSGTPGS